MSWARDALSPVLARTVPLRQRERVSETGQVSQIFIDGGEFLIIHSSDRTPWHLFAGIQQEELSGLVALMCLEKPRKPRLDAAEIGAHMGQSLQTPDQGKHATFAASFEQRPSHELARLVANQQPV
jgi:hypothetical protein